MPNHYRKRAGDILSRLFTKHDELCIGWDWEKDRDDAPPIKGEWLQSKGDPLNPSKESTILFLHGGAYYIGCYGIYRHFLSRIIKVNNSNEKTYCYIIDFFLKIIVFERSYMRY